jgi:transcriptional regulator GlxA family with amidase domain
MIYAENFLPRYNPDQQEPLTVAILVLDQSNMLSVAATVDPMRAANRKAGRQIFRWQFCTPFGEPVQLTSGIEINGPSISEIATPDMFCVVAGFGLEEPLEGLEPHLRRISRNLTVMVGIDGGTWILARAGILDGHRATTHWEDFDQFTVRFPRVDLVKDRFCISGRRMTTGGASPCIDMMLSLITHLFGPVLAARVAGVFIYDSAQDPQAPQQLHPTQAMAKQHPLVARAISVMQKDWSEPISITTLASELGVAKRTLETRFQTALKLSPGSYYLGLRLTEGYRLAKESTMPVQEIANITGFTSHSAFSRAFQNQFDTSVSALRKA